MLTNIRVLLIRIITIFNKNGSTINKTTSLPLLCEIVLVVLFI